MRLANKAMYGQLQGLLSLVQQEREARIDETVETFVSDLDEDSFGDRFGIGDSSPGTDQRKAREALKTKARQLQWVAAQDGESLSLADALDQLPAWLGRHAAYFTDALITADRYGLPLGPVLDQLSADVRADRSRQAQEQARTLPVKLSFPLVVCTLPSFVLLAIAPAVLGAISTITGTSP